MLVALPCRSAKPSSPIGQQDQHVDDADRAVTIEIPCAVIRRRARRARAPRGDQRQEIMDANLAVAVEVKLR